MTSPDGLVRYNVLAHEMIESSGTSLTASERFVYLASAVDALIAKLRKEAAKAHELRNQIAIENKRLFGELTAERARAEAFAKYVPNFAQNRYFNTDGQYAYERTIGEVRARFDEVCEGEHFTVVKPDSDLGYVICIGGIQPREHVIELLKERLAREYVDYLSATEGKGDAALAPTAETGKAE
jgi:hypothetical protein